MEIKLQTKSSEETFALGKKIATMLYGGEVICLRGDLGAGKTVLAKGLGEALEVKEHITSPTFTIIREHEAKIKNKLISFMHMDLYRLRSAEEAEIIGIPDYFRDDCICLIEWPEVIEELLPDERIEISILGSGEESRDIIIRTNKDQKHEVFDD